MPPAAAPRRALSLKWKTLVLLGLSLSVVHIGLVMLDYRNQLSQFLARQSLELDQKLSVLSQLLRQSELRLHRIGAIVPSIVDAMDADTSRGDRWSTLQLDLELQALQLYDADGSVLMRGLPYYGDTPPALLTQRVLQALASERPDGFLTCNQTCVQFALVPALSSSGQTRVMVVATSLIDLVVQFPQLARAELALVADAARPDGEGGPVLWPGTRLIALSDAPRNEPKLNALAQSTAINELHQGLGFTFAGRSYRAAARSFHSFGGIEEAHFLIFSDITEELGIIRSQIQRGFLTGGSALLVTLLLGLVILNRPMNQLRRLADALPLLANKAYEPARRLIGQDHRSSRLPTEIDVLEGVAMELTHRLESLEGLVETRNRALAEKIAELKRSQELNEKIFATAPIVMLMQSGGGEVVNANEFACTLLGYGPTELESASYLELLADERQRKEAGNAMMDLISGRRPVFEQTGPVRCFDGSLERVTWMHTRVSAQSGIFVLSLGLPDKSEHPQLSLA